MKTANVPTISGPLEQVCQRFERWRKTRKRCSSIPDALWAAAVELARQYGVNKAARALGLNYYSLKRRLESGTHAGLYEPKGGARFIELVTPLAWISTEKNSPNSDALLGFSSWSCAGRSRSTTGP